MAGEDISHGDIYHKMGVLEGKLDAVIVSVAEKKSDLGEAFRRIRVLEGRVAQGVILIAALAFSAPLIWNAVDPEVRLNPDGDIPSMVHPEAKP
jgi:hypothetical protein